MSNVLSEEKRQQVIALARLIQVRLAFTPGERWGAYYEVKDLRSPVLGMLNVRYLISRVRLPEDSRKRLQIRARTAWFLDL